MSANGKVKLDPEAVAWPCGLVAKSVFNDIYVLKDRSGNEIKIKQDGIAWESDKEYKFKNGNGDPSKGLAWDDVQWANVEDGKSIFSYKNAYDILYFLKKIFINKLFIEHFIVWMRTAGLPSFRKLWGRIE